MLSKNIQNYIVYIILLLKEEVIRKQSEHANTSIDKKQLSQKLYSIQGILTFEELYKMSSESLDSFSNRNALFGGFLIFHN